MDYEILNMLNLSSATWPEQQERMLRSDATLITLAPDPGILQKQKMTDVKILNIVDYVTGRTTNPETFMFFNQAPVVDGAEILMVKHGKIDVIKDGFRIGEVHTYLNSRRLVNNVTYFNLDGSKAMVEEYAFDGKLFSRLYYNDNQVQQIIFYNDNQDAVLTYYFYEGVINFVTVEDPKTHQIIERFDTLADFLANKVAEITKSKDQVGIIYLGIELTSLTFSQSNNTLYLVESPLDNDGNIRTNLNLILENKIKFIQHVVIKRDDAKLIELAGGKTDKLIVK